MEAEPTDSRAMQDDALNKALDAPTAEDLDGLSIQNQRLARIQEFEETAIARSDPLAAVLGIGNASLQRMFEHLGAALLDELDSHPHTVEELRELEPEMRLLVKLRKSIETGIALQSLGTDQQPAFPHNTRGKSRDTKLTTGKRDLLPKRWTENL
jgi:hypothetical protein